MAEQKQKRKLRKYTDEFKQQKAGCNESKVENVLNRQFQEQ